MVPFLTHVIDKIFADTSVPMHDVAVVLPNRRARRKLLQGLSERNGHVPMFAPQIFTMEEFVGWLSGLKVADPVTQLLHLHTLVRDFRNERFRLQNLLSWGPVFLKDISDMDMQMQDVPAILREYAQAARFEIPFGKDEPSDADREKILFNELLADIYLNYKKLILNCGEAYEGLVYRNCAESMSEYMAKIPFKRLLFAGFYALSPSELEIVRCLQEHFRTEVLFDIDPFYCHLDEAEKAYGAQRETSFFIHRNCEKLRIDIGKLEFCERDFASIPKRMSIMATSGNMRQIYCAIQEVERIVAEKKRQQGVPADDKETVLNMSDTAVVLADENLLLPFLLSYQPENAVVNATMGLPFSATPVSALLQQVVAVYESVFALTPDGASELLFSGEQLEQLWNHELLRDADTQPFYFPTVLRHSQIPNNELLVNLSKEELSRCLPSVLCSFCQLAKLKTASALYTALFDEVIKVLSELQALFDGHFVEKEEVDFPFAKYAVMKAVSAVSVNLQGDPDKGLQVMGLLETRLMDFRNVIMLSVNEGVLPKGITYDSLLPFDFKFKFDGKDALPNYLYQDQVYAYHFFRLLQRADRVTLIYNNASDVSMAERSRFIAQLEYEVETQRLAETIQIKHFQRDFDLELPPSEALQMKKTSEVMAMLHAHEFSASSLQTYIACPLKFCLRFLLGIRETKVLTDYLEPYELGTVIHALYKKALDEIARERNPENYSAILDKHIASTDKNACEEIMKLKDRKTLTMNDLNQGGWLINRRIVSETVGNYLEIAKTELAKSFWKITDNEKVIKIPKFEVKPEGGGSSFFVKLTGSLDRVQSFGNRVMILDYKTGKVEPGHLRLKDSAKTTKSVGKEVEQKAQDSGKKQEKKPEELLFSEVKYDKLFQLVFYALMYDYAVNPKPDSVEVGIVSTREVNKRSSNYVFYGSFLDDSNILAHKDLLLKQLNNLFLDIFNKDKPFLQTEDTKRCKNCDFLHLCNRQTEAENR